jgi:hypothetical protein
MTSTIPYINLLKEQWPDLSQWKDEATRIQEEIKAWQAIDTELTGAFDLDFAEGLIHLKSKLAIRPGDESLLKKATQLVKSFFEKNELENALDICQAALYQVTTASSYRGGLIMLRKAAEAWQALRSNLAEGRYKGCDDLIVTICQFEEAKTGLVKDLRIRFQSAVANNDFEKARSIRQWLALETVNGAEALALNDDILDKRQKEQENRLVIAALDQVLQKLNEAQTVEDIDQVIRSLNEFKDKHTESHDARFQAYFDVLETKSKLKKEVLPKIDIELEKASKELAFLQLLKQELPDDKDGQQKIATNIFEYIRFANEIYPGILHVRHVYEALLNEINGSSLIVGLLPPEETKNLVDLSKEVDKLLPVEVQKPAVISTGVDEPAPVVPQATASPANGDSELLPVVIQSSAVTPAEGDKLEPAEPQTPTITTLGAEKPTPVETKNPAGIASAGNKTTPVVKKGSISTSNKVDKLTEKKNGSVVKKVLTYGAVFLADIALVILMVLVISKYFPGQGTANGTDTGISPTNLPVIGGTITSVTPYPTYTPYPDSTPYPTYTPYPPPEVAVVVTTAPPPTTAPLELPIVVEMLKDSNVIDSLDNAAKSISSPILKKQPVKISGISKDKKFLQIYYAGNPKWIPIDAVTLDETIKSQLPIFTVP